MAEIRKLKQFHSCFVVDVEIDEENNVVWLRDSSRMKYKYCLETEDKANEFKAWLKAVFLAGKAQTLSVFRYHEEGQDPDVEVVIDKFIGDFKSSIRLYESETARYPV